MQFQVAITSRHSSNQTGPTESGQGALASGGQVRGNVGYAGMMIADIIPVSDKHEATAAGLLYDSSALSL